MKKAKCSNCGMEVERVRGAYRFEESALKNVVLLGVETARCPKCGNEDVFLPRVNKLMRALALAVINKPYRLQGDEVRFLGFDLERDTYSTGEAIHLVLHWEALSPMDTSYVVFTHLLGQEYNPQRGNFIWGQVDSLPLGGSYPTTGWAPGERVADEYWILIDPQAPPGDYELEVGMYEPATGVRLPVFDAQGVALGDRILLARLKVGVWP